MITKSEGCGSIFAWMDLEQTGLEYERRLLAYLRVRFLPQVRDDVLTKQSRLTWY